MSAVFPIPVSADTAGRSCRNCSIRGSCLAGALEDPALQYLESARGPVRIVRRGEYLFRAGSELSGLYVVRSGSFKASMSGSDGEEQVTGFHLPGELLGMDGLDDNRHRNTVVALETSSVCVFPLQKLNRLIHESAVLERQLWRLASRELLGGQEHLLLVARRDAEARLACFLLSLSARMKRTGCSPTEFRLSMGRREIGDYLGMTLETVSRLFTRFQDKGLISRDRRFVRIADLAGLHAVAGSEPAEARTRGMRLAPNRLPVSFTGARAA